MVDGHIGNISKENYLNADEQLQKSLIWDALEHIYDKQCSQPEICHEHWGKCDERMKKLENRKLYDKGLAGLAGLVGGFLASLLKRPL